MTGKTAKFPINDPIFDIEMIEETSANVNVPVGKVLFCSCRSFELIVAQPYIVYDEKMIKLPAWDCLRFQFLLNYKIRSQNGIELAGKLTTDGRQQLFENGRKYHHCQNLN